MFLNKYNLATIKFVASDKSRHSIQYVKIEKDKTVATDGKRLLEVTKPKDKTEDFPVFDGFPLSQKKAFYLDKTQVQKLLSLLPTKTSLPILQNIGISQNDKEETTLLLTDLDMQHTSKIKNLDIDFPSHEHLYPKSIPILKMNFNAKLLKEICEEVEKFSDDDSHTITLEFWEADKPMKFSATNSITKQKLQGLLMYVKTATENSNSIKIIKGK